MPIQTTLIYSADNPERSFGLDAAATAPALDTEDAATQLFEPSLQNADSESTALRQESSATAEDDDRTLLFGKATQQALQDQQTRLRTNTTQAQS